MGVSTDAMFGGGGEPAAPGSYGEAPRGFRLPDATELGTVHLQVADAGRSVEFYETVLGLRVRRASAGEALLGPHGDERVLLHLHERSGARPAMGRHLGLYHFAILLPDRPSLGRFVAHLADLGARAGAGDHLVSEAIYLQDPDGLGIEVYRDRPREAWKRVGRELMMATDPVDMHAVVESAGGEQWTGMPPGTVMGHVHLHVGDLAKASAFYSESIGFDRMVTRYPGALFLGAGGYHHHLGANTWAGPAASSPGKDDARLLEWTIVLPDARDVDAAAASLGAGGHDAERHERAVVARDPWGTQVRICTA